MKTITIQIPDDCEVQIVKKKEKEKPIIRIYQDLIDNYVNLSGYIINSSCEIKTYNTLAQKRFSEDIAASEKVAKSMLAMAMISQLMPYYGDMITDEEWKDGYINKFMIYRVGNTIRTANIHKPYQFLAFHTEKQRNDFLKYNEQLVKDYLMID